MEEEKISIKVNVADRSYPFKITANNEESIRAAARRINEQVAKYRQLYTDRDVQDALSMAALQFIIKLIELEKQENMSRVVEKFEALDRQLEEYLCAVE
jgi:cell division protein ZapA